MVDLYIDNKKVDLDKSVDIKLNKQLEDLINPTIIKTTYSRSIKVPITSNNNLIFSHYYRFDKILNILDFNPNQRVPYVLLHNSELLMKGYFKLTSIVDNNYEITLFDELTDLLRTISEKKLVDCMPLIPHQINRNVVINSWNFNPISTNNTSSLYDYITYVPAFKGNYENFKSDKIQYESGTINTLARELDEFDRQEFRSYYQCPAIYLNKMVKSITDANGIRLDEGFHNQLNPYWTNTVVMFPKLTTNNDEVSVSTYTTDTYGIVNYIVGSTGNLSIRYIGSQKFNDVSDPYNIVEVANPQLLDLTKYKTGSVKVDYEFKVKFKFNGSSTVHANKTLFPVSKEFPNASINRFRVASYIDGQTNPNNDNLYGGYVSGTTNIAITTDANGDGYLRRYEEGVNATVFTLKGTAYVPTTSSVQLRFNLDILLTAYGQVGTIAFKEYTAGFPNVTAAGFKITSEIVDIADSYVRISIDDTIRSNGNVNIYNIIPSDLTQGDFLLNYIKHFGLILDNDKDGYIIKDRNSYYSKGKVYDWSNKIDRNSSIELKPLPYENKYFTLGYEPNSTTHSENYDTISDISFSNVKIDTNYEFNVEEKELFKSKFNTPLISQEYYLNINTNKWSRLDYPSPAMHKIDGITKTKSEAKMTLLFKEPSMVLNDYHTEMPTKETLIRISDDTPQMQNNNEYTWVANDNVLYTSKYEDVDGNNLWPLFTSLTSDSKYSLDYGKNSKYYNNYVSDVNYLESATLYNKFFKSWVEDKYSNNTKILTCYVYLTTNEYKNLKLNSFIIINNTLFIINVITDFDIIQEGLTKVELTKVNNIDNYTRGQDIINENLTATTLSVDFTTGQLVETYDGTEDINFIVEDPNLIAISESEMYSTTIEIVDGNVIKSE